MMRKMHPAPALWITLCLLFSAACSPAAAPEPQSPTSATPAASATIPPSPTATPTHPPTTTPSATPPPASPTPAAQICSPLPGWDLATLQASIANRYAPPRLGSDDPHQGVDFAERQAGVGYAQEGHPVQAVLSGRVAAVIGERFPYGNAVLVETPLSDLPPEWREALAPPESLPEPLTNPALTCPEAALPAWDASQRSLYLLYAHMQAPPSVEPGQALACGADLGAVGMSGNALNPHLHLEARVGPSGATFPGLAHYETRATPEEMAAYCAWRVSGQFLTVDPMRLLALME